MNICQSLVFGVAAVVSGHHVSADYALFTDVTDTIKIEGNTVLGSAATYEARINLLGVGGRIFNEWKIKDEDKMLDLTNGTLSAYSYEVNKGNTFTTPVSLTPREWHHIAYVYDGAEERLYVDGQMIVARPGTGNISDASGSAANIGGFMREGFRPSFIGLLDTFRVSSVARYTGQSYTVPTGDFVSDADTQLLYNFTEVSGSTTIADLSPNGITGTLGAGYVDATSPRLVSGLPIPGDLDYDGFVGISDLNLVLSNWNVNAGPGVFQVGDTNADGFVGIEDLNFVLSNWNLGTPPADVSAMIPEPGTLAMALTGLVMMGYRRR